MTRRALPALVAVCLLICPVGGSLAAPPPQDKFAGMLARRRSAVVRHFSLFVAPQVTVARGWPS